MSVRIIIEGSILLIFLASQIFWIRRARDFFRRDSLRRLIPNSTARRVLGWSAVAGLVVLFLCNGWFGRTSSATHLTLWAALVEAPFKWWFFGSVLGFLVLTIFSIPARALELLVSAARRSSASPAAGGAADSAAPEDRPSKHSRLSQNPLSSLSRRRFLARTTTALGAVPFAAGAYGLLYERVDLEVTQQVIHLRRLQRAFDGFRIVQLSDIHIGPFMTATQIRKWVELANQLKPDLMVITGDYVIWDGHTQGAAVEELSRLRAPFGVVGCLGNHETWSHVEDSITRLFRAASVQILRCESKPLMAGGETLNLLGVDYQPDARVTHGKHIPARYLVGVDRLIRPDTANILLSHNPNSFDRAAELGIDLSLAGHTHGGQVTLEFISPDLSPSRLITRYLRGLYRKGNAQLYVNRGIGTIGIPIRLDAPPEITVFELKQEA